MIVISVSCTYAVTLILILLHTHLNQYECTCQYMDMLYACMLDCLLNSFPLFLACFLPSFLFLFPLPLSLPPPSLSLSQSNTSFFAPIFILSQIAAVLVFDMGPLLDLLSHLLLMQDTWQSHRISTALKGHYSGTANTHMYTVYTCFSLVVVQQGRKI